MPPAAALAAFQLEAGLRIELMAAEPLVVSPVAFAFDENRRLYVVEARGYPDPAEGKPSTTLGRIALLEDTDADGVYDRRREFASGFTNPNGIVVWRGGVFVTCAPDIFYLKDTSGDGVADERRVVLTGFDTSLTSQTRVSSPTLGLDGKIYVACGGSGGKVTSPEHPDRAPVVFTPTNGRFDPETLVYESIGGGGQFGFSFDAFGRRFTSSSRDPVRHSVLEPWFLKRNPHLAFAQTMQAVSKAQAEAKVSPISRSSVSADFIPALMSQPHSGTVTSACGLVVFDGSGLSPEHVGNVFFCEPAQNLIQRQVFRQAGASFRSDPPHKGREFLASTDVWFRPVFLANGPDGALYLADMHRREIDHPRFVPAEPRAKLDYESGKSAGRIYRVSREKQAAGPAPAKTIAELCRSMESPDSWRRERAQRLLIEKADTRAVPLLENCLNGAPLPEARTRALWTLRGLRQLSAAAISTALRDSDPGVREQGVLLVAEFREKMPGLNALLLATVDDPDARVRFVVALELGSLEDALAVPALARIAARDGEDRWARAAVLSGIGSRMPEFLEAFLLAPADNPDAFAAVMGDLARTFGAGASLEECRRFLVRMLSEIGDLGWRLPAVTGLAEGLRGRPDFKVPSGTNQLSALLVEGAPPSAEGALDDFFRRTAELAANGEAQTRQRANAVALLAYTDFARSGAVVGALLGNRVPLELQLQAIRALDRFGDPRGGEMFVQPQNWIRYTPQVREAVVSTLAARPQMTPVLFAALRRGDITPPEISLAQRARLLKHSDPAIRKDAEAVFQKLIGGDRMQVYQNYRGILDGPADPAQGGKVFARVCSVCHTYDGAGGNVGPDLTGIRHQPADALLLHILVPNLEVASGYQAVSVTTRDGRALSGWLAGETESSVTLRTPLGTEETVLRNNVVSLSAPGLSLMPDGLEHSMTKAELADLIAFLKTGTELSR